MLMCFGLGKQRSYDIDPGPDLLAFHRLVSKRWSGPKRHHKGQEKSKAAEQPKERDIFEYVRNNIIGNDLTFPGPYGAKKIVYCDSTASGRSLDFIEAFIRDNVLPSYGNTHTTTSQTALQTGQFRDDARSIIKKSVNGCSDDRVIFAGAGSTAAVQKLIHVLNFQSPPIVILSPYEHHSNLLPWKELGCEITWAQLLGNGDVDLKMLEKQLKTLSSRGREIVGSFSAGSNITGVLTDTDGIAFLLHKYKAFAFFDYASAGPYVKIDMNPGKSSKYGELSYKDAIFCSPHKFIGGPSTTGILVAKKRVFRNSVPSTPGGGTVLYVTETSHKYLADVHEKEEGGTPAIVESIRTGLVFQLKDAMRAERIMHRDEELVRRAHIKFSHCPNLILLGGMATTHKIPIFSFLIKHKQSGRFLHHNFVSKLLNDLFGIQCRGGCMCAGPYAEQLLGIDEPTALRIGDILFNDREQKKHRRRRAEILKPGFTRLNLPFYMDDETVEMILDAIVMVAEHGWKLLPQYKYNASTADWRHATYRCPSDGLRLDTVTYDRGTMHYADTVPLKSSAIGIPKNVLRTAKNIFDYTSLPQNHILPNKVIDLPKEWEDLRWFLHPLEAEIYLAGKEPATCTNFKMPFHPGKRKIGQASERHNTTMCTREKLCLCLSDAGTTLYMSW